MVTSSNAQSEDLCAAGEDCNYCSYSNAKAFTPRSRDTIVREHGSSSRHHFTVFSTRPRVHGCTVLIVECTIKETTFWIFIVETTQPSGTLEFPVANWHNGGLPALPPFPHVLQIEIQGTRCTLMGDVTGTRI
jgi:hypothetical protein